VDRQQDERPIREEHRDQRQAGDGYVNGEDVGDRLFDVVEDPPPQANRLDDGREIIVQQHRAGGFAGHVRAASAHGDADVGRFQGRGVVDPVARHSHDLASGLQGVDDAQLLLWDDAGDDVGRDEALPKLLLVHPIQLGAGDDLADGSQADLASDALCRGRVIARDHHHPDAGGVTFLDSSGNSGPDRVRQSHQAKEREREIVLLLRQVALCHGMALRHSQDPQAFPRHRRCPLQEVLAALPIEVAQVGNRFRRSLGGNHDLPGVG